MISRLESILIGSRNAQKLAEFYRDVVGLEVKFEGEMGEDGGRAYEIEIGGGSSIYVIDHSEVKGKNLTPQRLIINFEVDDIESEVKRLEEAGVNKIQDIYHVEEYGLIATFEDVDGNYFQLVQIRAKS